MSLGSWAGYRARALLAAVAVGWLYLRREPQGRGRLLLAMLRFGALALILLLLFDPASRTRARRGAGGTQVLLDASASMALPASPPSPRTRWQTAVGEARRLGGRPPLLFGERVRAVSRDSLPAEAPGDTRTMLVPALRAAAEAGAKRVVVLTDGGIEDAAVAPAWLSRLGLGVQWLPIGQPPSGLALEQVDAPAWAEAGQPVELELTVSALGARPDSTHVVVRQGERVIGEARLQAPPAGRSVRTRVSVRPSGPEAGGQVLLEVRLEPGDIIADDDRRVVSLFVSSEPTGAALVSLRPEQEPRFLLPVLARSLGLPVRGYQRVGPSGWLRLGEPQQAGRPVLEGDVARAAGRADLLVLSGLGSNPVPRWVVDLLRGRQPLLVLAEDAAAIPLPVSLGPPVTDDWFIAPEIPSSPVAVQLGGVMPSDLPPLQSLRSAEPGPGAWAPLRATRGRGGQGLPALLAGETAGRRWVMATAAGYWRWAFRGGESRALYERLWSAVAGWLVRDQVAAGGEGVRPVQPVVARGERSRWVTPGLATDSLRLQLSGGRGRGLDTVLLPVAGDTALAPLLEPGEYRWRATAFAGSRRAQGTGTLVMETYSPELSRPRLAGLAPAKGVGRETSAAAGSRPLHTAAWPYFVILLLLLAEWVLRRRWGLR